jgi:hypothetical protein
MAGRFAVIFILILIIMLSRNLLPTAQNPSISTSVSSAQYLRVQGRWKAVRASLGLPPISDHVRVASNLTVVKLQRDSRFDLKRKRALEESESHTIPLYFSPGALDKPSLTTQQLSEAFRAVALTEKQNAAEARQRAQKQGRKTQRRPSSWTVRG